MTIDRIATLKKRTGRTDPPIGLSFGVAGAMSAIGPKR